MPRRQLAESRQYLVGHPARPGRPQLAAGTTALGLEVDRRL